MCAAQSGPTGTARITASSSGVGSAMSRREVLDNLARETTHAKGLAYLVEDIPPTTAFRSQPGYVGASCDALLASDIEPLNDIYYSAC
jgi:hypothetical protein